MFIWYKKRRDMYLNNLRWAETTHPQEATLGWSFPSARNEVEHIGLSDHGLEVNQMVIVS